MRNTGLDEAQAGITIGRKNINNFRYADVQTHVRWISDAIQSSHPLPSPSPLTFNLPQHQVSSNESVLCIRWPKCWSFVISPSSEYSGLIPLGLTGWISLLSKGLSRAFSSTMVQKHQFFGTQASLWSSSYICTWLLEKTMASTIWSFVLYLVRNLVVVVSWFSSGQSAHSIILSVLYINSVYFVKKQSKKIFSTFFFVPFTSIYCHFCGLERSLRPGAIVPVCVSRSVVPNSLWPHGLQPTRLLYLWDFPGKDTGVGYHFLLQGIFPTQGSNLGLLPCRQIRHRLSYKGSFPNPTSS